MADAKKVVSSVTCPNGFHLKTEPVQGEIVVTFANGYVQTIIGTEAFFYYKQHSLGFLSQADYDARVQQLSQHKKPAQNKGEPRPPKAKKEPKPKTCFSCGSAEHLRKDCPTAPPTEAKDQKA